LIPSAGTEFQEKFSAGAAVVTQWVEKKLRFSTEIAVYLGNGMRWKVNRKSKVADQSVSVPMTLSDLERRNARDQIFQVITLVTPVPFDL